MIAPIHPLPVERPVTLGFLSVKLQPPQPEPLPDHNNRPRKASLESIVRNNAFVACAGRDHWIRSVPMRASTESIDIYLTPKRLSNY